MSGPTALTGRHKKIYATSEERKQRNRQAQAAFRERRTEYIKQLEQTIKHHEETLQNLQQSHRIAADECLMLRYNNSLLERILLEKGTLAIANFFCHLCSLSLSLYRHRRTSRASRKDRQSYPWSDSRPTRFRTHFSTCPALCYPQVPAESEIASSQS